MTAPPVSRKRWVMGAYFAVALTLLGSWQMTALFFPSFLLPNTWDVAVRLAKLVRTEEFLHSLATSFFRLAVGYGVSLLLGASLGLAAGMTRWFRDYLRAFIAVLQSVPPITWVPLLVIVLGFGDLPIIIIVSLASFFPMAHSVMSAGEAVDRLHIQVARTFGASRRQIARTVFLPAVFPAMITGAQISFGNAWRSLVASEMIAGVSVGLGWSISFAGEIADMAGVLANIVVIGSLAAIIDRTVLERVKHVLLRWRYV
jgi:NitT/TauT family transport system permease protein